jgi:hypothetical protein
MNNKRKMKKKYLLKLNKTSKEDPKSTERALQFGIRTQGLLYVTQKDLV